jgi:RNA polymerase sigma-70 factor (ECF subfamily)
MDDKSLVEAAKRGDRWAFGALFERHERMILSKAFNVTKNFEDSEDVLQQSFQKAFVHLEEFEGRSSFATWLTRIALNEALMLRRKWWKRQELSVDDQTGDEASTFISNIPDTRPNPEGSYSQQEYERHLFAAIDDLSPATRAALQTCDLNEKSIRETAQILGLSAMAVKSRLSRARKALREKLTLTRHSGKRCGAKSGN